MLAIFDVFDDWFHSPEFDTCPFINVLLEMRPTHPLDRAGATHLRTLHGLIAEQVTKAGLPDPHGLATTCIC